MKNKPNIILIIMDVQRASNIHCYGYEKQTTPNIDRIAKEGTIFLKCISPAVWTLPSHASIFTGRYVYSHGVGASYNYKPVEKYTLAEILSAAGYKTVGFCSKGHWWARYGIRDDRGFEEFYGVTFSSESEWIEVGSSKIIGLVKNWIEKHRHEEPFFIFINCLEPHLPYIPPEEYIRRFLGNMSLEEVKELQPNVWKVRMGLEKISKERWEKLRALYDGETACLDNRLNDLFVYLEESNLMDRTLLVITSDHGDEQGEHYPPHIAHQLHLYQPGIHVPLIVRYPDLFPQGEKVNELVQTLDIFPTILDVLSINNVDVWRQNQGISLLQIVNGKRKRLFALSEHQKPLLSFERMLRIDPSYDFRMWNRWVKALIIGDYKYIWSSNGDDELYNLKEDPIEQNNLAHEERDRVNEMKSKLYRILGSLERRDLGDLVQGLEDNVRALEKLGYLRKGGFEKGTIMEGLTP
ncbi:MAG: hypothetical protein DRJ51_02845 [Thermoprotei archaeon]|nr:MAG: hypothetical protein DRJ51_02845 [Thermoprotei archaeon]RLF02001.1 MAG: hypothetical protein DRJ59_04755 [Thermoprotei archaeon]